MDPADVHRALDRARGLHYEDHDGALAEAIRCHEVARTLGDSVLRCRALVLQAAVMLQRGDLRGAVELIAEAEPHAGDDNARAELAAVKAQLNFFAGSYAESLADAERGIALADQGGDLELRIFTRRCACVVFGNVGVSDWPARLDTVLRLAVEAGNQWEEAMSRNDLAHLIMEQGDLERAEREIDAARETAAPLAPHNRFALAVVSCTRSDIRLRAGRAEEALADAKYALELLMPDTDLRAAAAACERLRHTIRDEPWEHIAAGMTVTASAGVATAADASDLDALFELADRRLYEAKRSGRDRVVV